MITHFEVNDRSEPFSIRISVSDSAVSFSFLNSKSREVIHEVIMSFESAEKIISEGLRSLQSRNYMRHWSVLHDGSLLHKSTGYDIPVKWIQGKINMGRPVEDHIREKIWATQEVIDELESYLNYVRG